MAAINFSGFFGTPLDNDLMEDTTGTTPFNMMVQMPTPMIRGTPIPLGWEDESLDPDYQDYHVIVIIEGHSNIKVVDPVFKTMPADATIRTCSIAPPGVLGYNLPDEMLMKITNTCTRRFEQLISGNTGLFGKSPREIADRIASATKIGMETENSKTDHEMRMKYLESDPVISKRDKMYYERSWKFTKITEDSNGWVLIVKRQPRRRRVYGHNQWGQQTYSDEIIRDERGNIVYDVITERRYVDRIAEVDEHGVGRCILTKSEILTDLYMEGFRKILMVDMGCSDSKKTPRMVGLPRNVNGFRPEITEAFKRYGAYGGKKSRNKKSRNKKNKNKRKSKRTLDR